MEIVEMESKELTLPERAAVALDTSKHETALRELVKASASITVIKNTAARDQCHSALMTLVSTRTTIEKVGKAAREDATAFSKAVIAEEKRLAAIAETEETRLRTLRDAWDAEREAEKEAKREAERQRITKIRLTIDTIRKTPLDWVNKPSSEICVAADDLSEAVISEDFYQEFTNEAKTARDESVVQLRAMQSAMAAHEAEVAELARQKAVQAEAERLAVIARAEQEAKDREAQQAEEKRLAAIRAEQEAVLQAQRDAHAAQVRLDEEAAAERDRAAQAVRDAEEKRQADQRAEIQRQQDELDAIRQAQEAEAQRVREEAEAVERKKQVDADAAALAEANRLRDERLAAEAEAVRRVRVEFELNGPEPEEMIAILAAHYETEEETVLGWLTRHVWSVVEITA